MPNPVINETLPYNKEAQIHSLSLLANAAYDMQLPDLDSLQAFTTKVVTQALADPAIQECIGADWQTVWGPVVYSNNPHANEVVADNTLMLQYSKSQNLFVIGIAGTNIVSMYGWFQEDFQVSTCKLWSNVTGAIIPTPLNIISQGSYNGLQVLLGMTDGGKTMLQALSAYLQTNKISGAEAATAGHSLGGALAPVLAMYMQDTMKKWNTSGMALKVSAWPTAGPTPGNGTFAAYVAKNLPAYTSRYNPLDVIPQAWQKTTLAAIPGLYEGNIVPPAGSSPAETIIGTLALGAYLHTIDTTSRPMRMIDYQQIQPWTALGGSAFNAEVDAAVSSKFKYVGDILPKDYGLTPYKDYLVNLARFLEQMAYQHTTAYNLLLGINTFAADLSYVKHNCQPAGSKSPEQVREEALQRALLRFAGPGVLPVAAESLPAAEPELV